MKKTFLWISLFFLASACQPTPPTETPPPPPTAAPMIVTLPPDPTLQPTWTPLPTATPPPPSATPEATDTPLPPTVAPPPTEGPVCDEWREDFRYTDNEEYFEGKQPVIAWPVLRGAVAYRLTVNLEDAQMVHDFVYPPGSPDATPLPSPTPEPTVAGAVGGFAGEDAPTPTQEVGGLLEDGVLMVRYLVDTEKLARGPAVYGWMVLPLNDDGQFMCQGISGEFDYLPPGVERP